MTAINPPILIESRDSILAKFTELWSRVSQGFDASRGMIDIATWRRLRILEARVRMADAVENPAIARSSISRLPSWAIACGRDALPYLQRLQLPPHEPRVREIAEATWLELRTIFGEFEPVVEWTEADAHRQRRLIEKQEDGELLLDEESELAGLMQRHEASLDESDRLGMGDRLENIDALIAYFAKGRNAVTAH